MSMLQDFHGRYYHPSNARFWFYGDDPADERLHLLSKYLDEFEARPVDSTVHAQPLRQVQRSKLAPSFVDCTTNQSNFLP